MVKKDIFLKFIKLFRNIACLRYRSEVRRGLKDRLIQWFIGLIKWDMENFVGQTWLSEYQREKQKLYETIIEETKDERIKSEDKHGFM